MSALFDEAHLRPAWPTPGELPFAPTTVWDARAGAWQDRKRAWTSIGIKSELGRHCEGSYGWQDLADHPRMAESGKKIALVLSVGSASMRATQQFRIGRKLCRTHQTMLVFVKGSAELAAKACGGAAG